MIDDGVERDVRPGRTVETSIVRYDGSRGTRAYDSVVTEEPLELRLVAAATTHTLAITMRTPGNDFELAAGFVSGEGIIRAREEIVGVSYCVDPQIDAEQRYNIVNIELASSTLPDLTRFERHFTMNSSCGVCGRANLEALADLGVEPLRDDTRVPIAHIYELPERMRAAQRVFAMTGGLHAAALFDAKGATLAVREDVGRHNAVDKLLGEAFLQDATPLRNHLLLLSGRASFELLQKAVMGGIPMVAAIGAPSSLAIEVAREFSITLVGFLRPESFNIYSAPERVLGLNGTPYHC